MKTPIKLQKLTSLANQYNWDLEYDDDDSSEVILFKSLTVPKPLYKRVFSKEKTTEYYVGLSLYSDITGNCHCVEIMLTKPYLKKRNMLDTASSTIRQILKSPLDFIK